MCIRDRSEPPENLALHAIRAARIAAISEQEWTYLSWNTEKRSFDISTLGGGVVESIEVKRNIPINEDNLEVIFESMPSEFHDRAPFEFRSRSETALKRIAFSPQRVSTPFILKIIDGDIEFERTIDPFSSLPIEPEEDQ